MRDKLPKVRRRAPTLSGNPKIDQFDVIIGGHHDVFRLQIAVDDAVTMNVVERGRNVEGDFDGALGRKFLLFVDELAKRLPFHPFHRHVHLTVVGVVEDFHHAGMIELFTVFHDLRSSGVREMILAGVSPQVAKTISGHETDSMLNRYCILNTDDQRSGQQKRAEYVLEQRTAAQPGAATVQ